MIKVAHFICTDGLYGAERWILGLLRHSNKINSLLICPNSSDLTLLEEAKKQSIKTKILDVKGKYCFFDFINQLSNLLNQEQINILHTHGYKADILGYFSAKKAGIKVISTPHGWCPKEGGLKLRIYESLDKFILGFFDRVIPLSEGLRKTFKHIKKTKVKVINNFVDLDSIPKPKKGNPKLITFIGRLVESKRIQDLIISLKYVQDKNIKLQIIGNGIKKKELIKLTKKFNLQDKIRFLGYRNDALELLNKSGIFILPSLSEGTPRSLMEAMAMKKAVIGTDISGIRVLIKDKETGFLVPVKSPKRIAEAIEFLLNNPKKAREIAENGKRLIEQGFSAAKIAKEYEEVYSNILK
ncbi:glycosyltransferase [Candidatus Woesearchaeota archaeon]|nr:glycosyltransferase [Candidatus Woesearchaeota archaeon]